MDKIEREHQRLLTANRRTPLVFLARVDLGEKGVQIRMGKSDGTDLAAVVEQERSMVPIFHLSHVIPTCDPDTLHARMRAKFLAAGCIGTL